MSKVFAYIRVSTKDQDTGRQHAAVQEYERQNSCKAVIFEDHASGKDFDRPSYQRMKSRIKAGDILIVKELDRFGRNYDEIKKELGFFHSSGVRVVILDLPVLNTSDETLSALLSNLMIELLSYIAQKEREKIRSRVTEGLKNAKEKGIKLGRPEAGLPEGFQENYKRWLDGEITAVEFSKICNCSRSSLYRHVQNYENREKPLGIIDSLASGSV